MKFKNNILLVEDVNENPYSVDRMLSQLIFCGKLKKLSGILIGNFTNCTSNDTSLSVEKIIKDKLTPLGIPIIYGLKIGHEYPNITIPIGSSFKFFSKKNLLIQNEFIFK